jgi:hypothetical protein
VVDATDAGPVEQLAVRPLTIEESNVAPQGGYLPVPHWPRLPHGLSFGGDATSVAVDSQDLVHVFNRGPDPLMIFSPEGELIRAMGRGAFERPHSIRIDEEDCLHLVDDQAHRVEKRSHDGELIFTLAGERPAPAHGGRPFNRPTDVAIRPGTGELYVSDGYMNSSIHRFTPDGKHLMSWGSSGSHPGEFSLPHNLAFMGDDKLVVCDRENHRLQIFSPEGDWLDAWHAHHPGCVKWDDRTQLLYVGEMPPRSSTGQMEVPNLGARVKIFQTDGSIVAELGGPVKGTGDELDRFVTLHGITVDSHGAIYIAEVATTNLSREGELPVGREVMSLRKWVPTAR